MTDNQVIPGGYYINADGKGAHNANGEPIPLLDKDKEVGSKVEELPVEVLSSSNTLPDNQLHPDPSSEVPGTIEETSEEVPPVQEAPIKKPSKKKVD